MDRVYLDHAATTSMRPEAVDALTRALEAAPFNPSSQHREGRSARTLLDAARASVAQILGCRPREIIFTASGSESDTQAIVGVARARASRGRHIVSCVTEHHAVLHALDALRDEGFEVTLLPVDASGRISTEAFANALRDDTTLATIMLANNEVGVLAPIAELSAIARSRGVTLHTDAVQAPAWHAVRVSELGVDLLSLSGHKLRGPKGVGVLYAGAAAAPAPLVYGGAQEYGRRAGTENTAGIAAFARALELAEAERAEAALRVAALRDRLERTLNAIDRTRINGRDAQRLPNITSVSFDGLDSEALLMRLDLEGVAASAGSACTSGALEPSHVLAALGLDEHWLRGAIRFSLGTTTTPEEIARVCALLPRLVKELRESVGSAA